MSPRRRLRTRYEPVPEPAPAPGEPSARPAEPARPPAAETAIAPAATPAAGTSAPPAVPPALEAIPRPPAAPTPEAGSAPAPAVPAIAPPPAAEAAAVALPPAAEAAPAIPPPAPAETVLATGAAAAPADAPAGSPARASREVIEEWAAAFESPPAPVAAAPARRRRVGTVLTMVALAVLAFATGLVLFNNLVMPRLIHGVGQVTVPDLTNLSFEQAEEALRPLGLQASRAGERFDPTAPRGFVIAQEPAAGTTVRGSKRVSVIVSLGEEYSSVPELFGESVRAARMLIERAGLRPGTVVQAPSEEAGEGMVAGSDPGPETVLQRNTAVHLLVSTGAGPESFVMPDLLGREVAGVRRQLEALGFHVERDGPGAPVGTIAAQQPSPGSRITRETVIRLRASGRFIR